jgi:NAD(P)-dependent dehydrogenase (short-subunit alcohol dehydrogenase family)
VCRSDVTDAAACVEAATAAVDAFGRIDILVNVAGGSGPIGKTGANTTSEEFHDIVDLNMRGCFNTIRAVAPVMIARGYGHIVNVGGTFGMRGRAGRVAYSASKWGLRGITKSFALELGPHNINVNYVAPGMVDGPRFRDKICGEMAQRLGISEAEAAKRQPPVMRCGGSRRIPMSRMPACSWRRRFPGRSPGWICLSMAVGPLCSSRARSYGPVHQRSAAAVSGVSGVAAPPRSAPC